MADYSGSVTRGEYKAQDRTRRLECRALKLTGECAALRHKLTEAERQRDELVQFCKDFIAVNDLPMTRVWADTVEYPLVDGLVQLLDRAIILTSVKGNQ